MSEEIHRTKKGNYRSRRLIIVMVIALVIGIGIVVKHSRHHFIPKRFAVVEEGQIYRSGYLEQWPLERVIHDYKIKTILSLLNDEPNDPEQQQEERIAEREGVKLIRIGMPGDGCADYDLLDQAVEVIEDKNNRPLLVHCAAGVHRTGASIAAWRMKHCNWDVERAVKDMVNHGYKSWLKQDLAEHMRRYYQTRIASEYKNNTTSKQEKKTNPKMKE